MSVYTLCLFWRQDESSFLFSDPITVLTTISGHLDFMYVESFSAASSRATIRFISLSTRSVSSLLYLLYSRERCWCSICDITREDVRVDMTTFRSFHSVQVLVIQKWQTWETLSSLFSRRLLRKSYLSDCSNSRIFRAASFRFSWLCFVSVDVVVLGSRMIIRLGPFSFSFFLLFLLRFTSSYSSFDSAEDHLEVVFPTFQTHHLVAYHWLDVNPSWVCSFQSRPTCFECAVLYVWSCPVDSTVLLFWGLDTYLTLTLYSERDTVSIVFHCVHTVSTQMYTGRFGRDDFFLCRSRGSTRGEASFGFCELESRSNMKLTVSTFRRIDRFRTWFVDGVSVCDWSLSSNTTYKVYRPYVLSCILRNLWSDQRSHARIRLL